MFMISEGHGNPLQYSCLENPTDRGAWGGCKESDTTEANECTQCCYNDIMGHVFLHSVLEIRQLFYRKGK